MGAFLQLNRIIEALAGPRWARSRLTFDEQRVMQSYRTAQFGIQESINEPIIKALRGYDIDPDFRAELLTRFFSPAFQTRYTTVDADMRARIQARRCRPEDVLESEGGSEAGSEHGSRVGR
jgi:hypothetical protein